MAEHPRDGAAADGERRFVSFGPFRFDRHGLLLSRDGSPVAVPPKPLLVLRCLVDRPHEVVLKDELLDTVWDDAVVTESSLAEAVRVLRRALGDDPRSPAYIETVHRRGYRFVGEVLADRSESAPAPVGVSPAAMVAPAGDSADEYEIAAGAPPGGARAAEPSAIAGRGAMFLGLAGVFAVVALAWWSMDLWPAADRPDAGSAASAAAPGLVTGADPVEEALLWVGGAIPMPYGGSVFRFRVPKTGAAELDNTLGYPWFRQAYGFSFSWSGEMFVSDPTADAMFRFLDPSRRLLFNGTELRDMVLSPHWAIWVRDRMVLVDAVEDPPTGVVRSYVLDREGRLRPDRTLVTEPAGLFSFRALAVHPDTGEIFVSLCCTSNRIERYLPGDDGELVPNGSITGGDMHNPHDMVFSPWRELFVVNADDDSVSRFTFDDAGRAVAGALITGNSLNYPLGIDFSPWGELFVGNRFGPENGVSRFVFDDARNAIPNGTFATPIEVGDVQFEPAALPVRFEVRGGTIPPGDDGTVTVAIYSNADLDATTVEVDSISLVSGLAQLRSRGAAEVSRADLDDDGRVDLVVEVSTESLRSSGADAEVMLSGMTTDGARFRGVSPARILAR